MTTPKEALIQAANFVGYIGEYYNMPSEAALKIKEIKAAIPVVELEHQAAELLLEINPYLTEETNRKIIALREKLEVMP